MNSLVFLTYNSHINNKILLLLIGFRKGVFSHMLSKKMISVLLFFLLFSFFIFPDVSFLGAKNGLYLWFRTVIPSLFPFLFVSGFILRLGLISSFTPMLSPIFCRLFGCSTSGCYPIFIGFISGFPMGAKACADLVKHNEISKEEGQYLLSFVNNASPMFITSYLASQCLQLGNYRYIFFALIILSCILFSFCYRLFFRKQFTIHSKNILFKKTENKISILTISKSLDDSILDSFKTIVKIGGYIILFSIISQYVILLPIHFPIFQYLLIGAFEMTTAASYIGNSPFSTNIKIVLALVITCWGGLSSVFQTYSVIANTGLSIKKYCIHKLFQILFVLILGILFTLILI